MLVISVILSGERAGTVLGNRQITNTPEVSADFYLGGE